MSSNSRRGAQRARPPRPAAQRQAPAAPSRVLAAQADEDGTFRVPDDEIFDLDALRHEADGGERFHFRAGPERRIWELLTPEETDWLENSKIPERNPTGSDLRPLMRVLLTDQWEDFAQLDLQSGQMGALIDAWLDWHGIVPGEAPASRRS
jgi:hypothetical protein